MNDLSEATLKTARLTPDDGLFQLDTPEPSWIWVHTCATPKCPCRAATVVATHDGREALLARGAPVREAWIANEPYAKIAETIEGLVVFDLDIDTGEACHHGEDKPLDLAVHPAIAAIMAGIDGEILDAIGTLWYRGKGWPDPEQTALTSTPRIPAWKKGDKLSWDEACTGVRQDLYVQGDNLFEALDYYCPVPGCNCGEVDVPFVPARPEDPFPGRVVTNLSGQVNLVPEKGEEARLESLWAAFTTRHPRYLERFARRSAVLKTIGTRLIASSTIAGSKVGRNDPCPCGSGKKYKKCCAP